MSTISAVMPCWGRAASGSVRARHRPHEANWAYDVQTFRPVTRYPPSTGVARVEREARSLPASGSLKSWHQISSAERIGGR